MDRFLQSSTLSQHIKHVICHVHASLHSNSKYYVYVNKNGMLIFLHELFVHVRYAVLSPGQLLVKADAAGCWHSRVLVCVPVPHVVVQALQSVHAVQPVEPSV